MSDTQAIDLQVSNSFHYTTYGNANYHYFVVDLDGFVHLTAEAVRSGHWPGDYDLEDEQWAEETAEHNREATQLADARLAEWRG